MAYMNQERKAAIRAELVKVVPASWKWTLGVRHHSTIVFTVRSAPVDLIGEWLETVNAKRRANCDELRERPVHVDPNEYYLQDQFVASLPLMEAIKSALNLDNYDKSDVQTDYFDVGHYIDIKLGSWDKPFIYAESLKQAA